MKQNNSFNNDKFYIYTNGKESEINYLKLLKQKHSIYDVKIIYENSDPLRLVQRAIKDNNQNSKVWCVFDVDNSLKDGRLKKALVLAKENNIQLAVSNISFEVWLLSHYKVARKQMDNKELINEMNKLVMKLSNNKIKYNKGEITILEKYFIPKINDAIVNCKIGYQSYRKDNIRNIFDMNPVSTFFILVNALKLQDI